MEKMNNPGDYYRWKQAEAERVQEEIAQHQYASGHGREYFGMTCETCQKLQRQLALAQYVGD